MTTTAQAKEPFWAAVQTVSRMEHIVRREIEKTNHGAFLPTYVKFWKVDDKDYSKECPLFTGYVFFLTRPDDWAGIPDIHGIYRVLPCKVRPEEMQRLMIGHATDDHNVVAPPRFTRYYQKPTKKVARYRRPRPRPGKRVRVSNNMQQGANHASYAQR